MSQQVIIFILIYLLTLLLSASEVVPMSVAALIGALLTAWFGLQYGVFTYEEALGFIDMKLIGLVVGAMIVVEVARKSGLFHFGALYAVKLSGGKPVRLFVLISLISALVSMFLSDSTAILLITAAVITMAKILNYDPLPYFFSGIIMINLGGTSTLIGSVSNMIIGIEAGLSFNEFLNYLFLCELSLWALTILALYLLFKSRLGEERPPPEYDPWESIKDRKLFNRSIFVLALFLFLFVMSDNLGIGPEAVALGCGVLALALSGLDPSDVLREVDWETVFFIGGFLFVVGGLERTGVLMDLSTQLFRFTGNDPFVVPLFTLWFSGLVSTFISNIAVALTFTPIIKGFAWVNPKATWSALVLGTNLGGAATPLSGAVCVMAIGALKREGISLSFNQFTKVGFITTLIQLGFSSLYILLRFGLGG